MKFKDALIIALLGAGCPLLLFGSLLSSSISCRVDQEAGVVYPIGRKSDAYMLLVLVGLAQGAGAVWLGRSHLKQEEDEQPALAPSPVRGHLPAAMGETIPVRARVERPAMAHLYGEEADAMPQSRVFRAGGDRPSPSTQPFPTEYAWVKDLLHYPGLLVWGPQGSGKTSFATWLLKERIKHGHTAEVWDPHREFGQWEGLPVFGAGMDYETIDTRMAFFASDVQHQYRLRAEDPNYQPSKRTIVAEELTNWADRCSNSGEFLKTALSDIRKIGRCALLIAHDRTLSALGGAKGVSKARDAGLLELELEAKIDPVTGEACPALKGKLKYPGKEPVMVAIAPWMQASPDFTDLVGRVGQTGDRPRSEQEELRARLEGLITDSPTLTRSDSLPKKATDETETETSETTEGEGTEPTCLTAETFQKRFPETTETALFQLIQDGYENGLSPSDIVKQSLKLGKNYQLGKAACGYLVRKFGGVDLMLHFRRWLEE